ncbi:MAG: hypothetical protein AAF526_04690, partial [Pseudomonadota bacterium]
SRDGGADEVSCGYVTEKRPAGIGPSTSNSPDHHSNTPDTGDALTSEPDRRDRAAQIQGGQPGG